MFMHSIWVLTRRSTRRTVLSTLDTTGHRCEELSLGEETLGSAHTSGSLNGSRTVGEAVHHVDLWWHEAKTCSLQGRSGEGRHHRRRTGVDSPRVPNLKNNQRRESLGQYCLEKNAHGSPSMLWRCTWACHSILELLTSCQMGNSHWLCGVND